MNSTNIPVIGDVLVSTWGYEQTNSNYYKVTGVKGTFVTLIELDEVETAKPNCYGMFGTTMPVLNSTKGTSFRKKFKDGYNGGYYVTISNYASAHLWNGKPTEVSHTH
jgi:hypothetical protein